ncbi:MAG: homoserine dehydrogenase [Peptococcaceae bacterium]|nr:homoserine dehydrogenase [Peptococcaceae bacterium]
MDKIKIAVLGLGNVGQGVVTMLESQKERLAKNAGCVIELGKVLEKYLTKKRDVQLPEGLCTNRWEDILNDQSISVVVETIGGIEPARTYILQALQAGKNVVTANNDLLAEYGGELFQAARDAKRDLYFENSVGGAIPVVGVLRQNMSACRLSQIMGIINGTTNHVLTRMEQGIDFYKALAEAQEMGITEPDPMSDADGLDAARSIAILATLAFHSQVRFEDVYAEGISSITGDDIAIAKSLGYKIKAVAICRNDGEAIEVRVHPALIPFAHPLSGVKDTYYAIFIKGDELDETMFYGLGAGRWPSAVGVLDDVVAVVRNIQNHCVGRLNAIENRGLPILPMSKVRTRFYLRIRLADEPGALAAVTEILGNRHVSIARVNQTIMDKGVAEVVFITHEALEGDMREAAAAIGELPVTKRILSLLRVEGDHHA